MDEVLKIFGFLCALAGAGGLAYFLIGAAHITLRRMERRAELPPDREQEAKDLEARVEALEGLTTRMAELEERVDFAERLLARQREPERLGPGA